MSYRVSRVALKVGFKLYQPGDEIEESVLKGINPTNLEILFREGNITKDGADVDVTPEPEPIPLVSEPEIVVRGDGPKVSPAKLAAEIMEERGGSPEPTRTEADVIAELEAMEAKNEAPLVAEAEKAEADEPEDEPERDLVKEYHKQKRKEHPEDYEDSELGLDGEDEELIDDDEE